MKAREVKVKSRKLRIGGGRVDQNEGEREREDDRCLAREERMREWVCVLSVCRRSG
jgi:hypothetical protein